MKAQVFLLGHTGFIGKSIVEELNIKKINKFVSGEIKFIGISSRECDIRKPQSILYLSKLFTKNTTLIIAAAINRELGDTIDTMQTHIEMISNVARALEISPVKKCVYLSTADVYGRPKKLPITEETPIAPKTYYATAKYCCEQLLQITAQKASFPVLILRYNGVYGPGQKNFGYGPNFFIEGIVKEGVVRLWGNGQELRYNLYVKDLAKIIVKLSLGRSSGIYNIAKGRSKTFTQMLKTLKKLSAKKFKIVRQHRTSPAFDQVFDISKLKKELPGISFRPIEEALKETLSQVWLDKKNER